MPKPATLLAIAILASLPLGCRPSPGDQGAHAAKPAPPPSDAPLWGDVALKGACLLTETSAHGRRVTVLYSSFGRQPRLPAALVEELDAVELRSVPATKLVLGELYRDLHQAGFFELPRYRGRGPSPAREATDFYEVALVGNTRSWRVRASAPFDAAFARALGLTRSAIGAAQDARASPSRKGAGR